MLEAPDPMSNSCAYETPPTSWRCWFSRLFAASSITASHMIASAITLAALIAGGAAYGVIGGLLTMLSTPPSADGPGALEAAVGAIFMGVFFAASGALLALATMPVGLAVDVVRRSLRLSWGVTLLSSCVLFESSAVIIALSSTRSTGTAIISGTLWGVALTALFSLYWVPLGCTEAISCHALNIGRRFICRLQSPNQNSPPPSAPSAPGTAESPPAPDPALPSADPPGSSCGSAIPPRDR